MTIILRQKEDGKFVKKYMQKTCKNSKYDFFVKKGKRYLITIVIRTRTFLIFMNKVCWNKFLYSFVF